MTDIEEATVTFRKSDKQVTWLAKDRLTLLQLAEKHGLKPDYGCRSGACGTCEAKLLKGEIMGILEGDDGVLICSSVPASKEIELEL
jgi:ferredoxin